MRDYGPVVDHLDHRITLNGPEREADLSPACRQRGHGVVQHVCQHFADANGVDLERPSQPAVDRHRDPGIDRSIGVGQIVDDGVEIGRLRMKAQRTRLRETQSPKVLEQSLHGADVGQQ